MGTGKCVCDKPWHGSPNCESLVFGPTPVVRGYGDKVNVTSWGGSVAYSDEDGLYHMFVAEMAGHCPLSTWGSQSLVSHAVSADPLGPYVFANVSLMTWAHNPAIVTQKLANGTTLWVLFHIGDANSGEYKNCTKGTKETAEAAEVAADEDMMMMMMMTTTTTPAKEESVSAKLSRRNNKMKMVLRESQKHSAVKSAVQGSTLHVATSPYGPFVPVLPPPPSCNNPAPWLHANGTYFVVCDGFALYSAPAYTGPWTHVTQISAGGGLSGNYEDPYLFIDTRNNWHVIYHVYRTDGQDSTNCEPGHDGSVVAGHYFSQDGLKWRAAAVSPFGNTVELDNGQVQLLSTRERPKMLFDAKTGKPTHLFNGVCAGATTCPPTPCVNCKYNYWDFTNASPLVWQ